MFGNKKNLKKRVPKEIKLSDRKIIEDIDNDKDNDNDNECSKGISQDSHNED